MTADQLRDFSLLFNRRADAIAASARDAAVASLTSSFSLVRNADESGLSVQQRIDAMDARAPMASVRFFAQCRGQRAWLREFFPDTPLPHPESEFCLWSDPATGTAGLLHIPVPYDEYRVIRHDHLSRADAESYRDQLVSAWETAEATRLTALAEANRQPAIEPAPFIPDAPIPEPGA